MQEQQMKIKIANLLPQILFFAYFMKKLILCFHKYLCKESGDPKTEGQGRREIRIREA